MSKKRKKPMALSDQIRRAVDESGESRYEICKQTGIDKAAMSRFCSGRVGLTMANLDILAEHLGLRIAVDESRKPKGGKS